MPSWPAKNTSTNDFDNSSTLNYLLPMTPRQALNYLFAQLEEQDPTGDKTTIYLSPPLAAVLCRSTDLDIPLVVLQQEGVAALIEHGLFGYDVRLDTGARGYGMQVKTPE